MRVLTINSQYWPGFKAGGPIRSLVNLVEQLGDEITFDVVTGDRDLGDETPYPDVPVSEWTPVGKARVLYLSPEQLTLNRLARIIRDTPHDALYLNSFLNPHFSILPLTARRLGLIPRRPTIIAPRGEFSPEALALKPWKKRGYRIGGMAAGLFDGLTWQASAQSEAEQIARVMGRTAARIRIAPDLPAPIDLTRPLPTERGAGAPLRVVFLARIAPMKNLDFALEALARMREPVTFSLCGTFEDEAYWQACERQIAALPAHVDVVVRGQIDHPDVAGVLASQDLFFLPTRGENFGHGIVEAWSAGLPVLISTKTPWRDLTERGLGWDLPLTAPEPFAEVLDTLARENAALGAARKAKVREAAAALLAKLDARDANRALFLDLDAKAGSPSAPGPSSPA